MTGSIQRIGKEIEMSKRILLASLGILMSLTSFVGPAFSLLGYKTYLLLPSGLKNPPAGIFLHNTTQEHTAVILKAFGEQGILLKQFSLTLSPFESKAISLGGGEGELPNEAATVQVESDLPLDGSVIFKSLEVSTEAPSVSSNLAQVFDFPYRLSATGNSWTGYVLFNPNTSFASVVLHAFDENGIFLTEASLPPLSPQENKTRLPHCPLGFERVESLG